MHAPRTPPLLRVARENGLDGRHVQLLLKLSATIDESDAVANGTVLREGTVRDWARQAGFRHVQTLPIDNDFWRFYRLDA